MLWPGTASGVPCGPHLPRTFARTPQCAMLRSASLNCPCTAQRSHAQALPALQRPVALAWAPAAALRPHSHAVAGPAPSPHCRTAVVARAKRARKNEQPEYEDDEDLPSVSPEDLAALEEELGEGDDDGLDELRGNAFADMGLLDEYEEDDGDVIDVEPTQPDEDEGALDEAAGAGTRMQIITCLPSCVASHGPQKQHMAPPRCVWHACIPSTPPACAYPPCLFTPAAFKRPSGRSGSRGCRGALHLVPRRAGEEDARLRLVWRGGVRRAGAVACIT